MSIDKPDKIDAALAKRQIRLRTLIIAIAVLAPILYGLVELVKVGQALEDFYGPGGRLERMHRGEPDPGPRW